MRWLGAVGIFTLAEFGGNFAGSFAFFVLTRHLTGYATWTGIPLGLLQGMMSASIADWACRRWSRHGLELPLAWTAFSFTAIISGLGMLALAMGYPVSTNRLFATLANGGAWLAAASEGRPFRRQA